MSKTMFTVYDNAGSPIPAFIYLNGQGVAAADENGQVFLDSGFYEVRALGYKPQFVTVPDQTEVSLELDEGGQLTPIEITAYKEKKKPLFLALLILLIILNS